MSRLWPRIRHVIAQDTTSSRSVPIVRRYTQNIAGELDDAGPSQSVGGSAESGVRPQAHSNRRANVGMARAADIVTQLVEIDSEIVVHIRQVRVGIGAWSAHIADVHSGALAEVLP